jgi:hypothetical protein
LVAVVFAESLTCTVKLLLPAVVGVPEMTPAGLRERPPGKVPENTDHALPPAPPLAASVCEYAVPAVPFGSEDVATVRAAGAIAILSCFVAVVFDESLTCTVKLVLPAVLGVPEMTPAGLSERPAGRFPEDTAHELPPDPPLAASVCEYAVPAVPFGSEDVVTVRAAAAIAILSCFVAVVFDESFT